MDVTFTKLCIFTPTRSFYFVIHRGQDTKKQNIIFSNCMCYFMCNRE